MKVKDLQAEEDNKLLSKFRQGDIRSFEAIYNRYWERLYVTAHQVLKDEDTSKDIIQEIFLDIWNRRASIQIKNLRSFLYQAVKFQIAKHLRKRPFSPLHLEVLAELSDMESVEEIVQAKELSERIEQVVFTLPPRCQEIFRLSRFEHKSNQEIAQQLGISKSTVENQIHIALKVLHKYLDQSYSLLLICYWLY